MDTPKPYKPLYRPSSSSDDDVDVPPLLSRTSHHAIYIASLLFLTLTIPPVHPMKIDGALLCRPQISADHINEFLSSMTVSLRTIIQAEMGLPHEITKSGKHSVIIIEPEPDEVSADLVLHCEDLGIPYSPTSGSEFHNLCRILSSHLVPDKNLLMQTIVIHTKLKPLSLAFTIDNIQGSTDIKKQERLENFITFKATDTPFVTPFQMPVIKNTYDDIQGLLCSVDPAQDSNLKTDVHLLKDRAHTFAEDLENQIDEIVLLSNKLGLEYNQSTNKFSNTYSSNHCISTFVDLVPTKAIKNIQHEITNLLGDKLLATSENVHKIMYQMKVTGQELKLLGKTLDRISKGDFDMLQITNDFDTVIEALRNMNLDDPLTHFLLALGLGLLLIAACVCTISTCLCKKIRQQVIQNITDRYRT